VLAALEVASAALGKPTCQLAVVARLFASPRARGKAEGATAPGRRSRRGGLWSILDVDVDLAAAIALFESCGTKAGHGLLALYISFAEGKCLPQSAVIASRLRRISWSLLSCELSGAAPLTVACPRVQRVRRLVHCQVIARHVGVVSGGDVLDTSRFMREQPPDRYRQGSDSSQRAYYGRDLAGISQADISKVSDKPKHHTACSQAADPSRSSP